MAVLCTERVNFFVVKWKFAYLSKDLIKISVYVKNICVRTVFHDHRQVTYALSGTPQIITFQVAKKKNNMNQIANKQLETKYLWKR